MIKKKSSLELYVFGWFQASKICIFFWKVYCGASFEIIFRNNSLKPFAFSFYDSLPYDLEESTELRALSS